MNGSEWQLRREICAIGARMHERGLVAGTDGNLSARINRDRFLITPSGCCVGMMEPRDIVLIDESGAALDGRGRPSSERWMHLAAYAPRPEVMAAIHAHPPVVVAMTVAGVPMSQCALPELIYSLGEIALTGYATPGTEEGAVAVRELVKRHDALVLDRHGSLTVGKSLSDAFFKLEKLEHGAHVLYMAHLLGRVRDLPAEEVAKLAALRETLGLNKAGDIAAECFGANRGGRALAEARRAQRRDRI